MEVQSIKGIIDTTLTAAFSGVPFESGFFRTHMMWHIFPSSFRFLYTAYACHGIKYIHRWCRAGHHFGRVRFTVEGMRQTKRKGDMCLMPLSRLIYLNPYNRSSKYSPFNQEVEKSKAFNLRSVCMVVIESPYCPLLNTRCAAHALISLATVQGVTTSTPQWGQRGEYCDWSWNLGML